MFRIIRGAIIGALVVVLVFLCGSALLGGFALKAASDYGRTHDMGTEITVEDILKLDPDQTWETFCAGDRDPSWDAICSRKPSEFGTIRDAIKLPEEFMDYLGPLSR